MTEDSETDAKHGEPLEFKLPRCPRCGSLMRVRVEPDGFFLLCSRFPMCRRIAPYPWDTKGTGPSTQS